MYQDDMETSAWYFDGQTSQAHAVSLSIDGQKLHIRSNSCKSTYAEDIDVAVALSEVSWAERVEHGMRMAYLANGGMLQAQDNAAWDQWTARYYLGQHWVAKAQLRWDAALSSAAVLIVLLALFYVYGLPWFAEVIAPKVPVQLVAKIGSTLLTSLEGDYLQPSKLGVEQQKKIRDTFAKAVRQALGAAAPDYDLRFYASKLGPNALALPGGTIILTDELVSLPPSGVATQQLIGVLGHELGHLQHHDGMRTLIQFAALTVVIDILMGDASSTLTLLPTWLAQARYSRAIEHQADQASAALLRANGISPTVMAGFFEQLACYHAAKNAHDREPSFLNIAFSSHPADTERIAFFKKAASRLSEP